VDTRVDGESWRQWLRTGRRGTHVDRRRAKGAHSRLKKVLIEGKENGIGHPPERWEGFSSSMDRHTVDEALNALPEDHRTVVKLAYFYGLTNRQIAEQLGVTVGTVRTRLRQGLATASDYVERGRAATSKALYGVIFTLGVWLTGLQLVQDAQRQPSMGSDYLLQASVAVAAGAAAVALFFAQPTSPSQISQFDRGAGPIASAPSGSHDVAGTSEVGAPLSPAGGSAAHGVVTGVLPPNVLPNPANTVPSSLIPPVKVPVLPKLPPPPKLKPPLP